MFDTYCGVTGFVLKMSQTFRPFLWIVTSEITVIITVGAFLCALNLGIGVSAIAGGLIFLIPNSYFTFYAFRYSGAEAAQNIVRSFNRGQSGKLVLVALGFALAAKYVKPLQPVVLILSFIFMVLCHVFVAQHVAKKMAQTD